VKKIILLGSTGSIGKQVLELVEKYPHDYTVAGMSCHRMVELFAKQVENFNPDFAVITDEKLNEKFTMLAGKRSGTKYFSGQQGLLDMLEEAEADVVINGLVGAAGLLPTIKTIERGMRLALANKESIVVAGKIVTDLAREKDVEIIPVDSEHSAIWQCLVGEDRTKISKLILTASGGPFFNTPVSELSGVSIEDALNHPSWYMGKKITIDSATMMNKGFEVIEAYWLFGIPVERIRVVIHPQSIVHSMVEFIDGTIKAQLSIPDMRIPLLYAVNYPERVEYEWDGFSALDRFDLNFHPVDFEKFRCLTLAYEALKMGGTAPAAVNAANEEAVNLFLGKKIKFTQIPVLIEKALSEHKWSEKPDLDELLEVDKECRIKIRKGDYT